MKQNIFSAFPREAKRRAKFGALPFALVSDKAEASNLELVDTLFRPLGRIAFHDDPRRSHPRLFMHGGGELFHDDRGPDCTFQLRLEALATLAVNPSCARRLFGLLNRRAAA